MAIDDWLLLTIRWLHHLAAVSWVGGSIFFLLVVRPSLASQKNDSLIRDIGIQFRTVVNTTIFVLLITGAVLTVNRLTTNFTESQYIAVLSLKVFIALWMFWIASSLRRRQPPKPILAQDGKPSKLPRWMHRANLVLVMGIIIFLLADLLRALIERNIQLW